MQGVSETLARGNVKNIVISMEDRMGGRKHLTHLSHVEGFGLDPDELAAVLQKKWSTSCSVNKLPGKTETGKMLDLQGNLLKVLLCMPSPGVYTSICGGSNELALCAVGHDRLSLG